MNFSTVALDEVLANTVAALTKNGFNVLIAENGEDAKRIALSLVPEGAEVMTMSSETLRILGISKELNESGKWNSVRAKFAKLDRVKDHREMQRLGAAPEYSIGSVQGVTEDGHLLIASASGSQIPAPVYGADHAIFVVGTQKITPDLESAERRLREYVLPLEDARAMVAYKAHSAINFELRVNAVRPGRISIVFIKQAIGF